MCNSWELIIAIINIFVGIFIAVLQIRLTKQISNQTLSNQKGYFALKKAGKYDLEDAIRFSLLGNGDVILLSEQAIVNGNIIKKTDPCEQLFSKEGGEYGIDLKLNQNKLQLNRLDIEIVFELKNLAGYKYTETMKLVFKREEKEKLWVLSRQNILFKG